MFRSRLSVLRPHAILARPVLRSCRRFLSAQPVNEMVVPHLNASFPYRWLRDSCQCADCVHPSTQQKLHRSSDIPRDVVPKINGVHSEEGGLRIEWANGHSSHYTDDFLSRHSSPHQVAQFHRDTVREPWDSATFAASKTKFLTWEALYTDRGLLDGITQLERYGLLFLSGVPHEDTSDEGSAVRQIANRFSLLTDTFYGQTWDVQNIVNSRNIAYTNLNLGFHADLQYFDAPPHFQILHSIRNRVKGGTSLFVDAYAAAETLRRTDPAAYALLLSVPVPFHYINDGHHIHRTHTTLELTRFPNPRTGHHEFLRVNYAPPFQAPLPVNTPSAFYDALRRFAALLEEESAIHSYTLRETDAVVFDNRRVLHARTAFTDAEELEGGEGVNRWLKGCYFSADTMMDRGRVLRKKAEQGLL
ncbi:Clavaminate synthase-like protein [Vararia minispora EC-137]|uniref:Clavaminate synthase-like protein n=1 Tax=Vararia minispora EC-137 TaxID=1314806 RepID=A0ACB8QPX5_9AGAM|nr:Clavaminate synthase-like protein [Vararia minispora EC-137]